MAIDFDIDKFDITMTNSIWAMRFCYRGSLA